MNYSIRNTVTHVIVQQRKGVVNSVSGRVPFLIIYCQISLASSIPTERDPVCLGTKH
jgi:hypothetical protein